MKRNKTKCTPKTKRDTWHPTPTSALIQNLNSLKQQAKLHKNRTNRVRCHSALPAVGHMETAKDNVNKPWLCRHVKNGQGVLLTYTLYPILCHVYMGTIVSCTLWKVKRFLCNVAVALLGQALYINLKKEPKKDERAGHYRSKWICSSSKFPTR